MPNRCPRCNRKMEDIAAWWPVKLDNVTVHVCSSCYKEASQIDKAFADACAKAKRVWFDNAKVESVSIWGVDKEGTRVPFAGSISDS